MGVCDEKLSEQIIKISRAAAFIEAREHHLTAQVAADSVILKGRSPNFYLLLSVQGLIAWDFSLAMPKFQIISGTLLLDLFYNAYVRDANKII